VLRWFVFHEWRLPPCSARDPRSGRGHVADCFEIGRRNSDWDRPDGRAENSEPIGKFFRRSERE